MRFPWRRRREEELDEEIQSHLNMAAHDRMERGQSSAEAERSARRDLGNVGLVKEVTREMWGRTSLDRLHQDLRYGLRMLRRSPGFTAAAVLSLALGIGANTAIFSVEDTLILRRLPVRSPERLVVLNRIILTRPASIPYPMFQRFRALSQVFDGMAAVCQLGRSNVMIHGPGGGLESGLLRVNLVSGTYFPMLGVNAAIGRIITPSDDRVPGGHPVTVISYRYWERRFARAPDVVGRTLTLNNTTYTIVGIATKGFNGENITDPTDLWIPAAMESEVMPERPGLLANANAGWIRVIARLKPGISIQQAEPPLQVALQQYLREGAGSGATSQTLQNFAQQHITVDSVSTGFEVQREFFERPLKILMIVVGLVLLIACANVANLLLARSAARQREMAVRLAIGAGRMRIVRQLLTESVLLAILGSALGLVFAGAGTQVLLKLMAASRMPLVLDIHPDARILAYTAALCVLTGLLFGLAPATAGAKVSLSPSLNRRGADPSASGRRFGAGKPLVILQVALSLVLLIAAGLFVRTLNNLKSQDLGFNKDRLLLVWTSPRTSHIRGPALARLYDAAQERVASLPGVIAASPSSVGLLSGSILTRVLSVEGYVPRSDDDMRAQWMQVMPRFFDTVGTRLLLGRDFSRRDAETAPRVAIINETMARDFFAGQNPIGKRFGMGADEGYPVEIVGVVQDSKYFSLRDRNMRMMYLPYRQDLARLDRMCLTVRTAFDAPVLAAQIRDELRTIDASLAVTKIETIGEQIDETLVEDRLIAALSGCFGVLAVILACTGLYGVMAYTAARRTNEIGIRLALGSTRAGVLGMVLKESLVLVLAGIAIGMPATLITTRLISSQLFGIDAADPLTIAGATVLMIAIATLAGYIPAQRASKVDPMVALRYE